MFRIVNLRTNVVWPDEKGESERVFKNGDEAARAAVTLNSLHGRGWQIYVPRAHEDYPAGMRSDLQDWFEGDVRIHREDKWQVRKILNDEDWRKIQAEKIASGAFKPVPWHTHPKWIEWSAKSPQCDHFVHCSTKDQNAIAYTKNVEAGQMDIRTRISPSKYFEKFLKDVHNDSMPSYVSEWLATWKKHVSASELKFATTREEIRSVYVNGPDSCMSGERGISRGSSPHPVEAYSGGDLAIAYLLRKSGRINARAVVWPEKKMIGRLYGGDATLLNNLLRAEGYTTAASFENARLLAIDAEPYTKKPFTFICPYIDAPSQYISYDEAEKVLRLHNRKAEGCLAGNTQGGYVAFPLPFLSDFSGKKFSSASDPPMIVYISQKKTQTWAQSEVKEHAYTCFLRCRVYSRKDCPPTPVMTAGGNISFVSPFALDKLKIIKCGYYGCSVFYQETENVVVGYEPDGSLIRERWCQEARRWVFVYGERYFATWLRSRLPWASLHPANEEHRHPFSRVLSLESATYPCRVTRENADQYLRRAFIDPTGKWAVTSNAIAEKIEITLAEGPRE